ncbi:hypothetical protein Ddc_20566 [Ditylenchus destructor]|nr:hypothetical protein Ddc_20566 [Ditylenchus destructor]
MRVRFLLIVLASVHLTYVASELVTNFLVPEGSQDPSDNRYHSRMHRKNGELILEQLPPATNKSDSTPLNTTIGTTDRFKNDYSFSHNGKVTIAIKRRWLSLVPK